MLGLGAAPFAQIPAWPGGPGTEIGDVGAPGKLPAGLEPSGVTWHDGLARLVVVGDAGVVATMDVDGNDVSAWFPGGDLEGVALGPEGTTLVYLAREDPAAVLELDLATGQLTGATWNLQPWFTGPANRRLEAITRVDGLFYTGDQHDGTIRVFALGAEGAVQLVQSFPAPFGRDDLSGLDWQEDAGVLYAIHDAYDVVVEMTAAGAFSREYSLPGNDQEGIALVPICSTSDATVFVSEDSQELWRYPGYPVECAPCPAGSMPIRSNVGVRPLCFRALPRPIPRAEPRLQPVRMQTGVTSKPFDTRGGSSAGGTFSFDFAQPVEVRSIDLIGIASYPIPQEALVTLIDGSLEMRVYHAPSGFTEDRTLEGPPGSRSLDLTTLALQPGFLADATAAEDPGFDPKDVVRMEVFLTGSAAVDALEVRPQSEDSSPRPRRHRVPFTVPARR